MRASALDRSEHRDDRRHKHQEPTMPTPITDILSGRLGWRYFESGPSTRYKEYGDEMTKEEAERQSEIFVKALRQYDADTIQKLADVLHGCLKPVPCLSGACPICGRAARCLFVAACRAAAYRKDMLAVCVYWHDAAVGHGARELFKPLRERLAKALVDLRIPAIVGLDVSMIDCSDDDNEFDGYWVPHAWMLVPRRQMEQAAERFRRRFEPDRFTRYPLVMKPFDGSSPALFFAPELNLDCGLSDEDLANFGTDERTALALVLDDCGLDARLLLHGFDLGSLVSEA
jgi:hypothetical protein